jgi:hypothetical protein
VRRRSKRTNGAAGQAQNNVWSVVSSWLRDMRMNVVQISTAARSEWNWRGGWIPIVSWVIWNKNYCFVTLEVRNGRPEEREVI